MCTDLTSRSSLLGRALTRTPGDFGEASASAIGFIIFSQEYASHTLYACRLTPIPT